MQTIINHLRPLAFSLSVSLCVSPYVCVSLSLSLSVSLPMCVCLSLSVSLCVSPYVCVSLSVSLSLSLSLCLSLSTNLFLSIFFISLSFYISFPILYCLQFILLSVCVVLTSSPPTPWLQNITHLHFSIQGLTEERYGEGFVTNGAVNLWGKLNKGAKINIPVEALY